MTTPADTQHPQALTPEAPRAMTAASWLAHAAPDDDYLRGKHPRIDTSLWGVLFSWLAPLGITLGIMGIVRGSRGSKNTAAIVWGVVAIIVSLLIPVAATTAVLARSASFSVGDDIRSNLGINVAVPENARLLNDTKSGVLYDVSKRDNAPQWYGVYPTYIADADIANSLDAVFSALSDPANEYHSYWLYQLFDGYGYSVDTVDSVHIYGETIEVVLTLSDGSLMVAALHFVNDETTFVHYTYGSLVWLPYVLSIDELLGFDATADAQVWHQLVDSFSYTPEEYDYDFMEEYY